MGSAVCWPKDELKSIEKRLGAETRNYAHNIDVFNEWQKAKHSNRELLNVSISDGGQRNWSMDNYHSWYYLRQYAPFCDFNLYSSGYGADMLLWLIRQEKDLAVKLTLFDDLMQLSDFRIQEIDYLNDIAEQDLQIKASTLADAKCWKAHFYSEAGLALPEKFYDAKIAYKLWSEAFFQTLKNQESIQGTEIQGAFILECFKACTAIYEQNKEKNLEQYLLDYISLTTACEKLYTSAKSEKDPVLARQRFEQYFGPFQRIHEAFLKSGAGTPENLEKHFSAEFSNHISDTTYLNQAIKLMIHNNVFPSSKADMHSTIEDYSRLAYSAHPTFYSALAWGLTLKKMAVEDTAQTDTLRAQMRQVFEKGKQLAPSNAERALMCYQLGMALNYPLDSLSKTDIQKVGIWQSDLRGAVSQFREAAELDSLHYGICANWQASGAMVKLGGTYAHGTGDTEQYQYLLNRIESYIEANVFCEKALQQAEYASISGEQQQLGIQVNDYVNWALQRGTQNQKALDMLTTARKKYDIAIKDVRIKQAAYADYLSRKKREDDFWKCGK